MGLDEYMETGGSEESAGRSDRKPQFTLRMQGSEGYVGSGWMKQSKFGGNCIAVSLSTDLPKGARIYVNPTKANAGILG